MPEIENRMVVDSAWSRPKPERNDDDEQYEHGDQKVKESVNTLTGRKLKKQGFRNSKKMTVKEMEKAVLEMATKLDEMEQKLNRVESENTMLHLVERDNAAMFVTYIQMYDGIMKATLETAGSVGEARLWYEAWSKDIGKLQERNLTGDDFLKAVAEVNEKHGYEIEVNMFHEAIDEISEEERKRLSAA